MLISRSTDRIDSPRPRADAVGQGGPPSASKALSRQALKTPDAAAVVCAGRTHSYAWLNQEAESLARRLRSFGVGPNKIVGVALERSVEMVVSFLAVLKAGGAFLPFDPKYPYDRLKFTFDDARPRWCLTHESMLDSLPIGRGTVLWRDRQGLVIVGQRGAAHSSERTRNSDRLAYAIYTSGSTGHPKAAVLTQRGLANLIAAQRSLLRLSRGRRVLQFASSAFDAAVWEIFGTLTTGATLVLSDDRDILPGERLHQFIQRERIDTLTLPPSVLSLLSTSDLPTLQTVVVAGEACSSAVASRWSRGRRLINAYGPTEATVCATAFACACGDQAAPPIGRPLPGVEILLLDGDLRPVAEGEPGELCIAGAGLARGYWNRPELTAEKFIRHPLVQYHDGRLYRTGDLARWRDDGQLEFLGRIDRQVKVHGVRIELDEVTATIERHPAVQTAVTLATSDAAGVRLASFVLCRRDQAVTPSALRSWLRPWLPPAMLPASLSFVDRWPRLPNGKLDEAALLALGDPAASSLELQAESEKLSANQARCASTPHTAPVDVICDLFQHVLPVPHVGPHDDFFELGGGSLKAMEMLIEIEQRFGQRLSIGQFLRSPTAEAVAHWLTSRAPHRDAILVPLERKGSRPPLFLIHPAGGSVICYRALARALGGDQPCYGLQSPALVAYEEPLSSIEAMAERYLHELSSVAPDGACLLAGWSLGGLVAYEMACRLLASGRRAIGLVLIDSGILYSFQLLRQFVSTGDVPAFMWNVADRERMYEHIRQHAGSLLFPAKAGEAFSRRVFDVFWANVEAAYHYSPPDYEGLVTLVTGEQARGKHHPLDEWRRRCGNIQPVELPRTHLELLQPPVVEQLAEVIKTLSGKAGGWASWPVTKNGDGLGRPSSKPDGAC